MVQNCTLLCYVMLTDWTLILYRIGSTIITGLWNTFLSITRLAHTCVCDASVQKKHLAFKGFHNFIYIFFFNQQINK